MVVTCSLCKGTKELWGTSLEAKGPNEFFYLIILNSCASPAIAE